MGKARIDWSAGDSEFALLTVLDETGEALFQSLPPVRVSVEVVSENGDRLGEPAEVEVRAGEEILVELRAP